MPGNEQRRQQVCRKVPVVAVTAADGGADAPAAVIAMRRTGTGAGTGGDGMGLH